MQQGKFNRNYLYGLSFGNISIHATFPKILDTFAWWYFAAPPSCPVDWSAPAEWRLQCHLKRAQHETDQHKSRLSWGVSWGILEQIVNSQAKQNWKRQWNRESCGDPFQGPDISWYPWILITLWHSSCGQAKHWHVQVARGTHPLGQMPPRHPSSTSSDCRRYVPLCGVYRSFRSEIWAERLQKSLAAESHHAHGMNPWAIYQD